MKSSPPRRPNCSPGSEVKQHFSSGGERRFGSLGVVGRIEARYTLRTAWAGPWLAGRGGEGPSALSCTAVPARVRIARRASRRSAVLCGSADTRPMCLPCRFAACVATDVRSPDDLALPLGARHHHVGDELAVACAGVHTPGQGHDRALARSRESQDARETMHAASQAVELGDEEAPPFSS